MNDQRLTFIICSKIWFYVETSHVLHLDRDLNELKLKIKKHDAATSGHLLKTSLLKWLSLHNLYFFLFFFPFFPFFFFTKQYFSFFYKPEKLNYR